MKKFRADCNLSIRLSNGREWFFQKGICIQGDAEETLHRLIDLLEEATAAAEAEPEPKAPEGASLKNI